MKALPFVFSFVLVTAAAVGQTRSAASLSGTIVDLSYAFDSKTVYWPTAEAFHLEKDFEGVTDKGFYYSAYKYSAAEHGGTHLDAPVHFAKGRLGVDEIPLAQLIGSGIVVDVTRQCETNPDYRVTTEDLISLEKTMENAKRTSFCCARLRKIYPDRKKFWARMNVGAAPLQVHFPGLIPRCPLGNV